MSEFEDKLSAILSDRNAMDQIMALARSFSDPKQETVSTPQAYSATVVPEDPTRLLSGVDPALLQLGMRLLGEYNRPNERSAALLEALMPYVRPERRERLQRAQRIARLSRVARVLLELRGKRGDAEDV